MRTIVNYFFLFLLCTFACSSCVDAKKQVKVAIEAANSQCPMAISEDFELSAFSVEENNVVFTYIAKENVMSVETLSNCINSEDNIKVSAAQNNETKVLFKLMEEAEMGLVLRVKGEKSGFKNDIIFQSSDIKRWNQEIAEGKVDNSVASYLKTTMNSAKQSCPAQIDEYTVLSDCDYENNSIIYNYTILECEVLDMNSVKAAKNNFETMIRAGLTNKSDLALTNLLNKAREAGANFIYKYKGDTSGEEMEIVIDPKDL